jgi:hypothetical protein
VKGALRAVLVGVLGLFTVGYVLSVTVHVVPPSAATFELRKVTDRFVEPFFAQRWSFFAPAPPVVNTDLVAQARFVEAGGHIRTTDWFDVSAYLDGESKQRPLRPPRRYRTAANIGRALLGSAIGREHPERGPFLRPLSPAEVDARQHVLQRRYGDLAVRLAAHVLGGQRARAENLLSVQTQVVATPVSRFGQGRGRVPSARYLVWESGWRPAPGSGRLVGP